MLEGDLDLLDEHGWKKRRSCQSISARDRSIEEDEAAVGEEEHAAAGGLPILPRMVDGKQRPSATRAYLEVGKGKVQ